jgi:hypothetical protein
MRVICDRTCQIRIRGKVYTVSRNEKLTLDDAEFPTCPEYFHVLGENPRAVKKNLEVIDFDAISEGELMEMEGNLEELKKFLSIRYPQITFAKNIGWSTLVTRYLEVRNNMVTRIDNTGKVKHTVVELSTEFARMKEEPEKESSVEISKAFDDLDDIIGS